MNTVARLTGGVDMKNRQTLRLVYDLLGMTSSVLIGLGTSSWSIGIRTLLAFGAIHAAIEEMTMNQ